MTKALQFTTIVGRGRTQEFLIVYTQITGISALLFPLAGINLEWASQACEAHQENGYILETLVRFEKGRPAH